MDKQAFKQRMQNLKSYRENNPGKGYWDWKIEAFQDGGEVTRKSLRDIRKESTIGDKLDYNVMLQNQNTYQKEFATNWYKERAKNPKYRSQLGDGRLDKILSDIDKATWKNPTEAIKDRNKEYDNWIENEDAFRRAANFDRKYGTNYVRTYSDELKRKYQNSNDITQIGIKPMDPDTYGSFNPAIPDYIFISNNQIVNKKPRVGLINHELGHKIDRQAGVFGSDGKVVRPIFNRDKFESSNKIQNYLLKDSEIKSHMNEFRTYLRENNLLDPTGKESLNSFKKKLFNSNFDNLKKIFNSYKSGKQFIDDFNMIPITATNNNSDSILV